MIKNRKKLIVGNWKMNPAFLKEAKEIFSKIKNTVRKQSKKIETVICPPFVYLVNLQSTIKNLQLGAQDVFYESAGREDLSTYSKLPYTSQISALMLKNLGVKYVIVGHSERRVLGESNEMVAQKIRTCLKYFLIPIVCVGESNRDTSGNYLFFIKTQIEGVFKGVPKSALGKIVIAYEPIWAIGQKAKREATPTESQEMVMFIRKILSDLYDQASARQVRLLYGGSVNSKNAGDFLKNGGVDGLLVGRESLEPEKFEQIIKIADSF